MEDSYTFLKRVGKPLHGVRLVRYFFYVLHALFMRLLGHALTFLALYAVSHTTGFKLDLTPVYSFEEFGWDQLFTVVCGVAALFASIHCLRIIVFLLFFWVLNYSCTCVILEYEERPYGAISVRRVRVNSEEYSTKIYIDSDKRRNISNVFTIVTNAVTKQRYIF